MSLGVLTCLCVGLGAFVLRGFRWKNCLVMRCSVWVLIGDSDEVEVILKYK